MARRKFPEEFCSPRFAVSTITFNKRLHRSKILQTPVTASASRAPATDKSNLFFHVYLYLVLRNVPFFFFLSLSLSLSLSLEHGVRVNSHCCRYVGAIWVLARIVALTSAKIPRGGRSITLLCNKVFRSLCEISVTVVRIH